MDVGSRNRSLSCTSCMMLAALGSITEISNSNSQMLVLPVLAVMQKLTDMVDCNALDLRAVSNRTVTLAPLQSRASLRA